MHDLSEQFSFDVFLSHSSKDQDVVRTIAERLRKDGLKVWFDEWEIKPGDSIPAKIEVGLESARVLVLCMSTNAFGSDWAQLEAGMFRFRDPLNKERRFIPLRLDEAPIKGTLAQILHIRWLPSDRKKGYAKLVEACRPPASLPGTDAEPEREQAPEKAFQLDYDAVINAYAFSLDGKRALTGANDKTVRLWDVETGRCLLVFDGHGIGSIWGVAWSADQRRGISCSSDQTIRVWDIETGRCLYLLEGHTGPVLSLAWSNDQRSVLSTSEDKTVRLWDFETKRCLHVLEGHTSDVTSAAWRPDDGRVLSSSTDNTLRLWDVDTGLCLRVFEGHTSTVRRISWSRDQRRAVSCSHDGTVRLWDVKTGQCLRVLQGHTNSVECVIWSADERRVLSGAADKTVRLWDLETGRCLRMLKGHASHVSDLARSGNGQRAFSGDINGGIRVWDLSEFLTEAQVSQDSGSTLPAPPEQIQYTNAKVLLVGDSSAGKTGLSMRLAQNRWQPTDATVGPWAAQWRLPLPGTSGLECEIWLWDFGGQADQRLIQQFYMEETALAVLVFDGQKDELLTRLQHWNRDLTRAARKSFTKLLVAGRVDAGGLRVSRTAIDAFVQQHGFAGFLETSAKENVNCQELRDAILAGIRWAEIPWRTSPHLFQRLKEAIVEFKDEGRVLMRFNELRDALRLRLAGEGSQFNDEDLKAVIGLLAGPGVVWELKFGSWVLLQPERINGYAQALIETLRSDKLERGCILEEQVLSGDLMYPTAMKRLEAEEERFVLLAMHQTLIDRGLCLRELTGKGAVLSFPTYYRRERPELIGHPAVLVSYCFDGLLDEIYATLVVRLHHTEPFQQDQLWRYAADFRTLTGKQLGVKLTQRAEGSGELEVYFDPAIPVEEKIIYSRYIHEHLLQKDRSLRRLRHYVCPSCGTVVGNREVARKRLADWLERESARPKVLRWLMELAGFGKVPSIVCAECEGRVPLWDELEQWFASPEIQQRVRDLQARSSIELDNESKDRVLVGDVISTVALAGQICREFNVSDHGIDMEIEYKNDAGEASGRKLYLQLKSGDSYLRERKQDGVEIFTIKNERHARYWMDQAFHVMLVIRTSEGEIRWMEVRDWLKEEGRDGAETMRQIRFDGKRFDVMDVRLWRDRLLDGGVQ